MRVNGVVFDCGFGVGLTEDDNDTLCDRLTESDYVDIIWTSTAEVPGGSLIISRSFFF